MPKKIIIVRHGETEWNVTRRLQGWSDIPLNQTGRAQAHLAAIRLSKETVDVPTLPPGRSPNHMVSRPNSAKHSAKTAWGSLRVGNGRMR